MMCSFKTKKRLVFVHVLPRENYIILASVVVGVETSLENGDRQGRRRQRCHADEGRG